MTAPDRSSSSDSVLPAAPHVGIDVSKASLEIALIENIQREDLNPIEESRAYEYLMHNFDLSQENVAKRVGKSRSAVTNALRLLRLPQHILEQVAGGTLSMGHARSLLTLDQEEDMREAAEQISSNKLSVRETEKLVKKIKNYAQGEARQKAIPQVDPELLKLEDILRKNLGTKVKISPKGQGGKIEIAYTNASELERLLDYLNLV